MNGRSTSRERAAETGRFAFGENWQIFLKRLDERHIRRAEDSLRTMIRRDTLAGLRLLDVGSGSGLFSLAARRLGADVVSFDYDPQSVACAEQLRARFFPGDSRWVIERGSVLDTAFLARLGTFDVVYAWGVLHHTGEMWTAIENVLPLVKRAGTLALAIYNDQGRASRRWVQVKRLYNRLPPPLRGLVLWPAFARLWGPTVLRDALAGSPLRTWRRYGAERGMSPWRDVVDWVGGWPFEVAKPEEIFAFCRDRGFRLVDLKTCAGGLGCNEFVFTRAA